MQQSTQPLLPVDSQEKQFPNRLLKDKRFWFLVALFSAVVALILTPSASASAQSFEFDFTAIDLQPFFDGLQTWLPVFIAIFGFIGAIVGSMALARTLINAIINAFRGGSV